MVRNIEHYRDPEKVRTEAEITEPSDLDQDTADTSWDAKDVEYMRHALQIPIYILHKYEDIKVYVRLPPM